MSRKTLIENMLARFPEGTFERIDAVLADGENRAELVRRAVEQELKRRARHQARHSLPSDTRKAS